MKRFVYALAIGVGLTLVAVALEEILPSIAGAIMFPGFMLGSVLFGHSLAMVVVSLVANILLYTLGALFLLKTALPRTTETQSHGEKRALH